MWADGLKQPLLNQDGVMSPRSRGRRDGDGQRWVGKFLNHDGTENSIRREYPKSNGCAKDLNCGGDVCSSRSEVDAAERVQDMKKLGRAVAFCVVFMIVEVVGGIKAGSLAILTDAAHLLSDVASFAISLFAIWASGWESNLRQTYGFYRLEILGALVSIQIIWLITGIIIYEAWQRLLNQTVEIDGGLMFIIASVGLVVNLVMMFVLDHGHAHGPGGGHGHSHGAHGSGHSHKDGDEHNHEHHHGHKHSAEHDEDAHKGSHHLHDHGDQHTHDEHHHGDEHDLHRGESGRQIVSSAEGAEVVLKQGGHKTECVQENVTKARRSTAGDTIIVCICDEIEGQSSHSSSMAERSVRVTIDHGDHDQAHGGSSSINVRGAYLHVLGDLIQSVGVMIGGAIIWYNPAWKVVDLICTFFFSFVVLGTTIKLLRDILEVLMESTPRQVDAGALQKGLVEIDGVIAVHELHIWAITVGKVLLACHVTIEPDADADDVLQEVIQYCDKKYKISHVTIQIERSRQ